ncbi:hypothetical protein LPJ53_003998 [Coemansia erecta]|uniref:NADH:flavin oxidoreductase/NADH oxidase N-terminal domain-containing protein n=1 Tax=Coemansia erecta TaxID=147472 RepID=A0A9W7XZZ2_9FUNG|nr:hypothetical protein LPJ53_003998 [Coemansia erecta]
MRGAGLVMVEATAVLEDGRISPHCLGLWKGEQISGLKRIVDHMHQYGTVAGIQLSHSGRLGSSIPLDQYKEGASCRSNHDAGGWPDRVYGPSAVPFSDQFWNPKELSLEQIEEIQKAFVDAAIRADKAGFDVVDIHAAYGFLLNQFLSPLSNRRTDQYGGSFSNRIRMLVETVRQVRQVWPAEKPLFVSISAVEGAPGGWTFDETASLANILAGEGVDLSEVSEGGNIADAVIPKDHKYRIKVAKSLNEQAPGLLIGAVGLLNDAIQANAILEEQVADAVFSARQFLRNPSFVLSAAHDLGVDIKWINQYECARVKQKYSFF